MNIVFYLMVAVMVVLIWFGMSSLFKPIGRAFTKLWENAKKEMNSNDK